MDYDLTDVAQNIEDLGETLYDDVAADGEYDPCDKRWTAKIGRIVDASCNNGIDNRILKRLSLAIDEDVQLGFKDAVKDLKSYFNMLLSLKESKNIFSTKQQKLFEAILDNSEEYDDYDLDGGVADRKTPSPYIPYTDEVDLDKKWDNSRDTDTLSYVDLLSDDEIKDLGYEKVGTRNGYLPDGGAPWGADEFRKPGSKRKMSRWEISSSRTEKPLAADKEFYADRNGDDAAYAGNDELDADIPGSKDYRDLNYYDMASTNFENEEDYADILNDNETIPSF